jgi:hypothetical protein
MPVKKRIAKSTIRDAFVILPDCTILVFWFGRPFEKITPR